MDIAWLMIVVLFFGACDLAIHLIDGLRGDS